MTNLGCPQSTFRTSSPFSIGSAVSIVARSHSMTRKLKRTNGSKSAIEWRECPRIQPGTYLAYCKWATRYRDPAFQRWTCLLIWDVLKDDLLTVIATIPWWLPLGTREKPWASRRGKYLPEWVRANGGPPVRGDRLSPRVFTRRMARVEVGDTDPTKSPVPYSVVKKIVRWETGSGAGHSVSKSHSQGRHGLNAPQRKPCDE
jgi:hypothetical protein